MGAARSSSGRAGASGSRKRSAAGKGKRSSATQSKPSFAGDRVCAHLRRFELAGAVGAAGHISGDDGKPRCFVRALLA